MSSIRAAAIRLAKNTAHAGVSRRKFGENNDILSSPFLAGDGIGTFI